ncbi:MAG TPA: SLBB domain-containing protein [Desulfatiglandales bacterium]|nr:SLBB domain-containing protein [Desulfatiglandales bacterium]
MKKSFIHIFIQLLLIILLSSIASADFCLQLGSFKDEQDAKKYVNELIQWKYKAFIFQQKGQAADSTPWYKVRIGPFVEKEKALILKKEIKSKGLGNDIILVKVSDGNPAGAKEVDSIANENSQNKMPKKRAFEPTQIRNYTYIEKVAAPDHRDITLEWDAIQDSDITGYKIYYDTDPEPPYNPDRNAWADEGPPPITVGKDETRITLHGLSASKDYHFSITSFNEKIAPQKAQHFNAKRVSTNAFPDPSDQAIASFKQDMGGIRTLSDTTDTEIKKDFTLKWDASADPNITDYKIYYDTDTGPPYNPENEDLSDEGPPPIIVKKGVTDITIHGLRTDKDYYFSITAFNSKTGLESAYSGEIVVRSQIPTVDVSPFNKASKEIFRPETPKTLPTRSGQSEKKSPVTLIADKTIETGDATDRIYPGDVLMIDVPGQKEMSQKYDVDPNGNIYMVTVGKVDVKGLDPSGLVGKLAETLKQLISPTETDKIHAQILERTRYIEIQGGVRYHGWYRVPVTMSLDELIELAGGLLSGVDYTRITLRRITPDGVKEIGAKGEITLQPDDVLKVPSPGEYRKKVDKGDLLFIGIPQRQPPTRVPSTSDTADLREVYIRNQIEVDANGYIYLPDYGHFYVNGLTPEAVKQAIIERLPKYLAMLEKVEVNIIEKKHYIQISGYVNKPGSYNIPETADAQAALNQAGQATDGAVMSDVTIQRQYKGKIKNIRINLYIYSITGDKRLLTPLHEGDELFVPITPSFGNIKRTLRTWEPPTERLEKDIKQKVRIFGAVHNPGIYESFEDMNLLDLMILASGETEYADISKILIIRQDQVEEEFNLQAFLKYEGTEKGSLLLPEIKNGDTVYVRFLEWKTAEPKEDKVFYVSGKVKTPGQYKLWDQMTVLQAIALAGGLDEWADEKHITIVRIVSGKQENIPFNFRKGISGKLHELNVSLQADDVVVVP